MIGSASAFASREVVFIETNVPNWQDLAANVRSGAEVVILDATRDGLALIADWAREHTQYDAIHLISHGSRGSLQLGSFALDEAALGQRAEDLLVVGSALKAGGDLLLYGCDVAAGDVGTSFVKALGEATGADIAASVDTTGAAMLGGNWTLEYAEPDVMQRSMEFSGFASTLDTVTFVENSAEDFDGNSNNFFTRAVQGGVFTFQAGSAVTNEQASYLDIQTDSDPRYATGIGPGIYALSSRAFGSGTDFSISVAPGYTFDLTGFRTQGRETTLTAFYVKGGATSSKTFTVGADTAESFSGLTDFDDVTEVVLTSNNYALFQDLVITDVRASGSSSAPTVTGVSSSTADGSYSAGSVVSIQVAFSEAVTVTGTPQLFLETGAVDRYINYTGGSGTSTLTFNYTVQAGASSADLDYHSVSALGLNGGAIKNAANVSAVLTLPTPGAPGSLGFGKNIVLDTTAPAAPTGLALAAGSDTGKSTTDGITSDATPTVTGTAEANATVTLLDFDTSTALGNTTADGSGNWSITSSILAEGTYRLSARAQDAAGNISPTATTRNITVDTTAPDITLGPVKLNLDSGRDSNDFVTRIATDTVSGTLSTAPAAGDAVELSVDGGVSWQSTTLSGLSWSRSGVTLPANGTLQVRVVDLAGNVASNGSFSTPVVVDTAAPAKSAAPTLSTTSDTGASNTDGITNLTSLVVTGKAEANAAVYLYDTDGTTGVGATLADALGDWSITTSTLTSGAHTLTIRTEDLAGNLSVPSDGLAVTIDTTPAAVPAIPALAVGNDTGTSTTDRITKINTPTFAGSGVSEANVTIEVYGSYTNSKGQLATVLVATGKSDGTGNWTASATTTLEDATYQVQARSVDLAGNTSTLSGSRLVQIDATAPIAPTIRLAPGSDTGMSPSDGITNLSLPSFTGTAEKITNIQLYAADGVTVLGSTVSSNSGSSTWSILPSTPLPEGTQTLTVKSTDAAGNVSVAGTITITVDRTAPAAPGGIALAAGQDTGVSATDGLTSITTPTVTGTADVGTTVTLYDTNGTTVLGSAVSGAGGIWSIKSSPLTAGAHSLTTKAVDIAGNASASSGVLAITVDALAPAAPPAPVLDAASDTGTLGDGITSITTPVINGTAETFAAVTLYDSDETTVLGTTFADQSGNWSIASSKLADGAHTLTVKAVDAAGNTSGASAGLALTIDTTVPAATPSTVKFSADSGRASGDLVTRISAQSVTGTLDAPLAADERVQVSFDGGTTWRDAVSATGDTNWTLGATIGGTGVLQVRVVDAAGNANATLLSRTYTYDATAPTQPGAPVLAEASDKGVSSSDGITSVAQPVFSGKAEADAAVFLYGTDSAGKTTILGGTVADASGDWHLTSARIADGSHSLIVRAEDVAGNVSMASTALPVVIDTVAPAVSSISIPNTPLRIGDTATATITTTSDADTYTLGTGSMIAGMTLGNLTKLDATTYTATFTVEEGTDIAASADLPTSVVLIDRAGNANTAYTTPITQPGDAIDATRPTFTSATVNGATLTLTYGEALSTTSAGSSAFTVLANGVPVAVDAVSASGTTVTLTLASAVASGATVTVAYADPDPSSDNTFAIQDAAGNDAATLTETSVTNTTAAPPTPDPTPSITPGPDLVTGTSGSERIDGLAGNDTITGGAGNDTLFGGAGADQITATPGLGQVAFLYGGTGPDNPDDGADTIIVSGRGAASVWGNGGGDTIRYTAEGAATVYAGAGADTVNVTNNAANLLIGGGGPGGDVLTVRGNGANTVYGGASSVDPNDGADRILIVGNGANTLFGNGGGDRIEIQGSGPNLVYAGLGADEVIITGSGANTVYGGTGAGDVITIRGDGNNVVYGGSFNGDAADGADTIRIEGNGANTVYANGGDDVVVLSGTGANTVYGGVGNDTILGGSGNDRIIGGPGANVLGGGAGADRFVVGAGEVDFITDFQLAQGDRIETGGQLYTVTSTSEGYAAITLANGSFIVLQGVAPGSVTVDYFA
ncbi:Ig-like domain-containing protein [Aureimonas sp. ME7]|uniref:Ig-like domain-containing protein n=1 Tax=Aureimonas sp. ME7 TaxID=2744252 RepID=UPI0015FD151F|nr:Ig-like domain-containing protein [Aureimonas sp. ME7]